MIYLDYAATTPLDPRAEEAMRPFAREIFGNPSSLHGPGRQARAAVDDARDEAVGSPEIDPDDFAHDGWLAPLLRFFPLKSGQEVVHVGALEEERPQRLERLALLHGRHAGLHPAVPLFHQRVKATVVVGRLCLDRPARGREPRP